MAENDGAAAATTDGNEGAATTQQQTQQPPAGEAVAQEWFWSEGVKGSDKAPDWYDGKKYKTVADQAKAYGDASKLIGTQAAELATLRAGQPKAPEKYDYVLPEQYATSLEVKTDDPLLGKLAEIGKKHNFTQAQFNDIFALGTELIANYELIDPAQEKQLMGDHADDRIQAVMGWAKANVAPESLPALEQALSGWTRPADVFRLVESVIAGHRQPAMPAVGADVQTGITLADVEREQFRTNDKGQRLYEVDPTHRKKVMDMRKQVVGPGEDIEIIGKRA